MLTALLEEPEITVREKEEVVYIIQFSLSSLITGD
jgi:hypothetical protein